MVRFQCAQPSGEFLDQQSAEYDPLPFLGHLPVHPHAGPWTKYGERVRHKLCVGCRLWLQQLSLEHGRYYSIYTGKHYGQLQLHTVTLPMATAWSQTLCTLA